MRCGFCFAWLYEGEGRTITSGDGLFATAWVCIDEEACWERQDYNDWLDGVQPRGRRTSWVIVSARTAEGEPVL